MLRFWLVGFSGVACVLTGCIDVSFSEGTGTTTTGTGGATTATTSIGGGSTDDSTTSTSTSGAGGSGGGAPMPDCTNKRCGPDGIGGLCNGKPMAATWSVNLSSGVRAIVPWPETQSLLVTMSQDHAARIDECDGSVMAENPTVSASAGDNRPYLMAAGLYDGQLMILGASSWAGANPDRRYYLDASSPDLALASSETLNNGWGKAAGYGFADPTGLYVAQATGAVGFLPPAAPVCSSSYGSFSGFTARGILRTPTAVYTANVGSAFPTLVVGKLLSVCPEACNCQGSTTRSLANNVIYNDLVDSGVDVIGAGTSANTRARLGHLDPMTLNESNVLDVDSGASSGNSTLLTAAVAGSFVYAGGARTLSDADAYARDPQGGVAVLYRVPTAFDSNTTADVVVLTGGARVREVLGDANGIYAGGTKADEASGFLAKCTAALDCDPLPP